MSQTDSPPPQPQEEPWIERHIGTFVGVFIAILALVGVLVNAHFQSEANVYAANQNYRAADRQSDIKMVEIAVGILRAPVSEDLSVIREWAMDVIDAGKSRRFNKQERAALLKKPLPADIGMKFERADPCTATFAFEFKDKDFWKLFEALCAQREKSEPVPMPKP